MEINSHTANTKTDLPIIDKDTLAMAGFSCHYCSKFLCTRQRLDSHIMRYHRKTEAEDPTPNKIQRLDSQGKTEDDIKLARDPDIKRIEKQTGGGYDADSSDNGDSEEHVSEEDNSENSEASEDKKEEEGAVESEEEEDVTEEELDVDSEEEEDVGEEYDIFDKVLELAKQNLADSKEKATHRDLQMEFRRVYKDMVLQKRMLNKSKEHKRIMKTVEELRERHEDFTFEEALDEAVRLRRRILDNMVPGPDDVQDSDDQSV